jgi:hypothetical protein
MSNLINTIRKRYTSRDPSSKDHPYNAANMYDASNMSYERQKELRDKIIDESPYDKCAKYLLEICKTQGGPAAQREYTNTIHRFQMKENEARLLKDKFLKLLAEAIPTNSMGPPGKKTEKFSKEQDKEGKPKEVKGDKDGAVAPIKLSNKETDDPNSIKLGGVTKVDTSPQLQKPNLNSKTTKTDRKYGTVAQTESEEISEVSDKTLKSYVAKASSDIDKKKIKDYDHPGLSKRYQGLNKAVDKLTREDRIQKILRIIEEKRKKLKSFISKVPVDQGEYSMVSEKKETKRRKSMSWYNKGVQNYGGAGWNEGQSGVVDISPACTESEKICHKCKGKGCSHCHGTGKINEEKVDRRYGLGLTKSQRAYLPKAGIGIEPGQPTRDYDLAAPKKKN